MLELTWNYGLSRSAELHSVFTYNHLVVALPFLHQRRTADSGMDKFFQSASDLPSRKHPPTIAAAPALVQTQKRRLAKCAAHAPPCTPLPKALSHAALHRSAIPVRREHIKMR